MKTGSDHFFALAGGGYAAQLAVKVRTLHTMTGDLARCKTPWSYAAPTGKSSRSVRRPTCLSPTVGA
jgi:hypothetical protein